MLLKLGNPDKQWPRSRGDSKEEIVPNLNELLVEAPSQIRFLRLAQGQVKIHKRVSLKRTSFE